MRWADPRSRVLRGPQGTLYGRNATGVVVDLDVDEELNGVPVLQGFPGIAGYKAATWGLPRTAGLELRYLW